MKSRMDNPATIIPDVLPALMALGKTMRTGALPVGTAALVHIRASQVNGCSFCLDMHVREAKKAGETDERLFAVGAWRDAPYFTEAERAALALTEAVTRLSDNPDPVPDAIWDEAARHYDEPQLAALVVAIAAINAFNRVNAATRQITGDYVARIVEASAGAAA